MKTMKIRKLTALCLMMVMSMMTLAPALSVVAADTFTVGTVVQQGGGSGYYPIIKAKWEMKGAIAFDTTTPPNVTNLSDFTTDLDDNEALPKTQINPTGTLTTPYAPYTICAIVTDGVPNSTGNPNLAGVWAKEIRYPVDVAFHSDGNDEINGGYDTCQNTPQGESSSGYDTGTEGCDALMTTDELVLTRLTKDDGMELFCDNVRNYGSDNLTEYYDSYNANEICSDELPQEHAFVYCNTRDLYYEDPAGDYKVTVKAQNLNTKEDVEYNYFTYVGMDAFEVDFETVGIDYGTIDHLSLPGGTEYWYGPHGDDNMITTAAPTVRNLGNTRLYIGVEQDDMGFTTAGGVSNVRYRARIGHEADDWFEYNPNELAWMEDILDLSKDRKMDFQIKVAQWPAGAGGGSMVLSCQKAEFRHCSP